MDAAHTAVTAKGLRLIALRERYYKGHPLWERSLTANSLPLIAY